MATVTDVDNTGSPVKRATVTGRFPGDWMRLPTVSLMQMALRYLRHRPHCPKTITANFCVDGVQSSLIFDAANSTDMCTQ